MLKPDIIKRVGEFICVIKVNEVALVYMFRLRVIGLFRRHRGWFR